MELVGHWNDQQFDALPCLPRLSALLSATFAALTAIFAKVGIENVNSDYATFIRTIVILIAAGGIVLATGHWQAPGTVSA